MADVNANNTNGQFNPKVPAVPVAPNAAKFQPGVPAVPIPKLKPDEGPGAEAAGFGATSEFEQVPAVEAACQAEAVAPACEAAPEAAASVLEIEHAALQPDASSALTEPSSDLNDLAATPSDVSRPAEMTSEIAENAVAQQDVSRPAEATDALEVHNAVISATADDSQTSSEPTNEPTNEIADINPQLEAAEPESIFREPDVFREDGGGGSIDPGPDEVELLRKGADGVAETLEEEVLMKTNNTNETIHQIENGNEAMNESNEINSSAPVNEEGALPAPMSDVENAVEALGNAADAAAETSTERTEGSAAISDATSGADDSPATAPARAGRGASRAAAGRAAKARPARPLNPRARSGAAAVAAANRAAALAANSHEAAFARERALFLGGGLEGEGAAPGGGGSPEAPGERPGLSPAARRARRREGAARFGRKAMSVFMALVLAIGLMPLPAFGDDGQVRGVSFNGNLIAGSISTTTTVDADGNVTTETTRTKVDDEGNAVSETETDESSGDGSDGGLDDDANLRGQYYLSQATALKSDGTIQDLAGTDIGKVADDSDSRLSVAAGAQALEDKEGEAQQSAVDEAQAAYDAEDAAIDVSQVEGDFGSQRIVVALEGGAAPMARDSNNVATSGDGLYVLAYKDVDSAKRAYVRYTRYEGVAFVAPDAAVEASADGGGEADGGEGGDPLPADDGPDAEGAAEADTDAPEADLSTLERDKGELEAEASTPGPGRAAVVALVDTMVAQDYEGVERLSVLDGSQEEVADGDPDRDAKVAAQHGTHGSRMVDAIRGQNPGARIVAIEALDASGYGSVASVVAAAKLAAASGAQVVNMSFAGYNTAANEGLVEAASIAAAGRDAGDPSDDAVVLAAAGNGGQDARWFLPAAAGDAHAVGALDASKVAALRGAVASELGAPGDAAEGPSGSALADVEGAVSAAAAREAAVSAEVAARVAADPDACRLESSNYGDTVEAWVVASSTSEAAALASGYVSANSGGGWLDALRTSPVAVGGSREPEAGEGEDSGQGQDTSDIEPTPGSTEPAGDIADQREASEAEPDYRVLDIVTNEIDLAIEEEVPNEVRDIASIVKKNLNAAGVWAADGIMPATQVTNPNAAVTVELGETMTPVVGSVTYKYHNGSAVATNGSANINYFQLNDVTVSKPSTVTNKITRLTFNSTGKKYDATSSEGVFIHIPGTEIDTTTATQTALSSATVSSNTFTYYLFTDTLTTTNRRHMQYTVIFPGGIDVAQAKIFIEKNTYFLLGDNATAAPTPRSVMTSGSTVTIQADWAASTNVASNTALKYARIDDYIYDDNFTIGYFADNDARTSFTNAGKATRTVHDSPEHFYLLAGASETFWAAYNRAKGYYFDGMRGYMHTATSAQEHTRLNTIIGNGAYHMDIERYYRVSGTEVGTNTSTQVQSANGGAGGWDTDSLPTGSSSGSGFRYANTHLTDRKWWIFQGGPEAGLPHGREDSTGIAYRPNRTSEQSKPANLYYDQTQVYHNWPGSEPNFSSGQESIVTWYAASVWNDLTDSSAQNSIIEFSGYNRVVEASKTATMILKDYDIEYRKGVQGTDDGAEHTFWGLSTGLSYVASYDEAMGWYKPAAGWELDKWAVTVDGSSQPIGYVQLDAVIEKKGDNWVDSAHGDEVVAWKFSDGSEVTSTYKDKVVLTAVYKHKTFDIIYDYGQDDGYTADLTTEATPASGTYLDRVVATELTPLNSYDADHLYHIAGWSLKGDSPGFNDILPENAFTKDSWTTVTDASKTPTEITAAERTANAVTLYAVWVPNEKEVRFTLNRPREASRLPPGISAGCI